MTNRKLALGTLALLAAPGISPASAAQSAPATPACTAAEHRQFDFWIGHWDVVNTKDGTPAGSSVIESVYRACTLRENWTEPGFAGGSLNTYVEADRRWHQTWTDSQGSWREFVGGMQGGKMVLVYTHASIRYPGKTVQIRMTFTRQPGGSVRQYSDQSVDGANWVERYDYTYRRHNSAG